jgi:hypothetical protein
MLCSFTTGVVGCGRASTVRPPLLAMTCDGVSTGAAEDADPGTIADGAGTGTKPAVVAAGAGAGTKPAVVVAGKLGDEPPRLKSPGGASWLEPGTTANG